MNSRPADNFTVCRTCGGLAGYPEGRQAYPQSCRCRAAQRWPYHDFSQYQDLCWCCLLEAIPSGCRLSPFYCSECLRQADAHNESLGRVLLFVGRHSVMNFVARRGARAPRPKVDECGETLQVFGKSIVGFFEVMERWRPVRLRAVLEAIGRIGQSESHGISLVEYLRAAEGLIDHPEVGKRAAFDALCAYLGYPTMEV